MSAESTTDSVAAALCSAKTMYSKLQPTTISSSFKLNALHKVVGGQAKRIHLLKLHMANLPSEQVTAPSVHVSESTIEEVDLAEADEVDEEAAAAAAARVEVEDEGAGVSKTVVVAASNSTTSGVMIPFAETDVVLVDV